MKKGLSGLVLVLFYTCQLFAQEVRQVSPIFFYSHNFDNSSTANFTYRDVTANHESITTSTTSPLAGTASLRSVNRATPFSNAIYRQMLPASTDLADGSNWEFDFLYKYSTANSGADIVDFATGGVASGTGGWRYWIIANNTNPSANSGLGLYFSQAGNTLYFRSKESNTYIRDVINYTLTPNTTYIIKVIITSGRYRIYIDEYNSYSTTTTQRGGNQNFGGGVTSYQYSVLEVDEKRSSANFQFDDLKAYKQAISLTANSSLNTSSNGITNADIGEGQKNVIALGFSLAARGYFSLTQLQFELLGGNFSKYFSSIRVYKSADNIYSLFNDELILTITPQSSSTSTNTISIPLYTATYPSTDTYYFVVLDLLPDFSETGDASYNLRNPVIRYDNLNGGTTALSVTYDGQTFYEHIAYKWVGGTSTDFGTNTNWYYDQFRYYSPYGNNGVPQYSPPSGSYVYIPNTANNSPISTSDLTLNGMTIESGKTLTLNNASLSVSNAFSSDGTVAFTGTNNSTFTLGSSLTPYLGTLSVTKNGIGKTVTLTSTNPNLNITNTINVKDATLVTNGKLTLKSSATQTGSISRLDQTAMNGTVDAAISGNVNAERFVTGGSSYNTTRGNYTYRNYRLMSSPVSNNSSPATSYTVDYIAAGAIVTGATGTGTYSTTGNPTLYLYREDFNGNSTSFTSGNFRGINSFATGVTVTSDASTYYLYPGTGFLFYFRGNKTTNLTLKTTSPFVGPENVVFSNTGTINQGNISYKNWKTGSLGLSNTTVNAKLSARGLNLAGNPYPSSISWTAVYSASTNIDGTIYMFDPVTGQYGSYTQGAGTGTNNASNVISSGLGFFVKALNSSAALNFTEACKITTQNSGNALLLGVPVQNAQNQSHLKLQLVKDSLNYDEVVIGLRKGAVVDYNEAQDAYDLGGSGALESMSVVSGTNNNEINLASKYYPYPKKQQEIPLLVDATASGRFTLNLKEIKDFPNVYQVWLKDAYMKDSLDIKNNPNYIFDIEKGNPATYGNSRLKLVIKQVNDYRFLAISAEKATDGVLLKWKTEKEYNYLTFTVEHSTDGGKTFMPLGSVQSNGNGAYSFVDKYPVLGVNVYRIKQDDFNNEISYSKDATVAYEDKTVTGEVLTVYPNPTPDNLNVKITSASTSGSSYNIRIANSRGDFVKEVTISQQTWQGNVTDLLPGTYFIQVIDNHTQSVVGNSKFTKI